MAQPNFKSRDFWIAEITAFFKNNPQFYTPANKALLEKEFLSLIDTYKPFLESLVSICVTSVDSANVIKFVWFAKKTGFNNHNILTIFRHISGGMAKEGRLFINAIGSKLLGIEAAAKKIGSASAVFLIISVAVQVVIHIRRDEYGLAIGEIIKTVFSLACAPAAVFDMFDQILGVLFPDFMKNPFVRCLRLLNGVQGAKHLADTLYTLGEIAGYAYLHRQVEIERTLNALATRWEQSPFAIMSEAARGTTALLELYLPDWAKFDWIVNLAEYHRNHPLEWAK